MHGAQEILHASHSFPEGKHAKSLEHHACLVLPWLGIAWPGLTDGLAWPSQVVIWGVTVSMVCLCASLVVGWGVAVCVSSSVFLACAPFLLQDGDPCLQVFCGLSQPCCILQFRGLLAILSKIS